MKKYYIILLCLFVSMFVFTGCDNTSREDSNESWEEESSEDEGTIIGINKHKDRLNDDIGQEEEEQEPISIREKINTNVSEGAYNELTHKFSLYDFDGFKICQFSLPPSCEIVFEADNKESFTISVKTRDYYTLWISDYVVDGEDKYILYGTVPNESYYQDYKCEYELIKKDELTLYKVHSSYTRNDEQRDNYMILVPYYNLDGEVQFIEIRCLENFYNDLDDGLYNVIYSLFCNSFNGNGDSLLEHHDTYSPDIDDMEIYSEETGEFTLFTTSGYKIMTLHVPDGYILNSTSDQGFIYRIVDEENKWSGDICISSLLSSPLSELIHCGGVNEDYYPDFTYKFSGEIIAGYSCQIVMYEYDRNDSKRKGISILIPYSLDHGEEGYVEIQIPEKLIDRWDEDIKDVVVEMLGG